MKMFIKLFFSLLLMVSIFTETSYAKDEIEIQSNVADFYSYGKNPSITKLDNGLVISMVEGQTTDFLYYQLGEEKKGRVEWSDDQIQYAIGKEPSVTILGNGDVLTTYELRRPGTIERIDLYYSIGRYKDGKINWYSKDNLLIRDSWNASITTLSNGKVILSAQKALYDRMDYGIGYQVGNFDEDKGEMTWSESHLFDNGVDPSMEQLDNGYILTVYETGVVDYENEGDFKHRGTGELNYKIGIINENDQIEWTTEKDHFSYGKDPSIIVLDDGRVLNVYGGQTSDNLWYRLGEYIDDELYWSEQINFGTAKNADIVEMDNELNRVLIVSEMNAEIHEQIGRYEDDQLVWNLPLNSDSNYGVGENPSITVLDNGLVLSTKDHKGDLLYQLGEYIDGEMYWTDPVKYDTGKKPSVLSLGDGYVVDVHEGGIGFIYYNLGRYENGEINWYSVGNHYVTHGDSYSPQIDILSNGTIVNVYHTSFFGVAYNLYYQHATFENGTLEWIDTSIASDFYDNGNYPNIAVLKDDYILETHSGENSADLWYSIGKAQDYSIDFISAEKYVSRMHRPVSLQLDNGYVLSMYTQAGNLEKYFPAYSQIATVQNEKLSWESWNGEERYTSFEGLDNDIVQLNNGLILNVHEERFNDEGRASDNIQYVLGKWSDDSKRVEWMVD